MEENSDKNDTMSDVSDEDDNVGFSFLVNEVLEENQSQFEKSTISLSRKTQTFPKRKLERKQTK